jgi:hypothetical protein
MLVILLAVATVVSTASQQGGAGAPPTQPADMHNSRNSLDWAGTYEGVLPCAADSALSNLLAKPLQVQMTGRPSARLQLASPGNGTLNFTGEPTPESLYGAGTTVFLEIAAQSVACPNPPSPNTRCLQYRERHYDDKGLAVGTPGEWKPLAVNILGFTHREGVRNVLRVKQFQGPASAGGAPSNLYVLDLVVESEIVKP